jgi:hypothetical protein
MATLLILVFCLGKYSGQIYKSLKDLCKSSDAPFLSVKSVIPGIIGVAKKGKQRITESWKSNPTVKDVDQDSFIGNHIQMPDADDDLEL